MLVSSSLWFAPLPSRDSIQKGKERAYELTALKALSEGMMPVSSLPRVRDPLSSAREVTIESIEPCLLFVVKRAVKLLECWLNCLCCGQ
jgi:hypothetical protein